MNSRCRSALVVSLLVGYMTSCPASEVLAGTPGGGRDALNYGDTIAGSLTDPDQVDEHTFTASVGDVILIRVVELTSAIEPYVRLTNPFGIEVGEDWGYSLAEIVTVPVGVSGTYTIRVWDNNTDETGDYSLHLQCINDPPGAIAFPLGATLGGTVAEPAQSVAYTLAGAVGDQLVVRLAEADGSGDYYPEVRVYAPDGTPLASSTGGAVAGLNTVALLASGIHTVLVLDYHGTDIGDYLLHVQRTNDPAGAVALAYDQTLAGSLTQRAQTVAYTFAATAGDVVLARLVELINPLEPQVRLYGPDGIQITGDWGYTLAEFLTTGLPVGGTHTLLVMDNPGVDTGDYSLHLQCINDPPGAIAFPLGATLGGTVAEPAQSVAYTLAGAVGDQLVVRLAEADGSGDYYPEVRVYAPDGTPLASSTGGAVAGLNTVALLASGTHTVLVLDYHGTDIGDYLLHVQRTNDPAGAVALAYDQTLAGSLTQRAQTVAYTFAATAGDVVLARLVELINPLEPQVRLYGPDGIQITGDWGYTLAEFLTTGLPVGGTHTLLVMDNPGVDTGDYSLHLQCINDPPGAIAFPLGATLGGTVAEPAQSVAYTLAGAVGDQLVVRLAEADGSGDYYPEVRVYAPDGTPLASSTGGAVAGLNTVALLASGIHTVLVLDYHGTDIGDYLLHVQRTNDPAGAVALAYDQTLAGSLTQRAQTVAYTFAATAGDVVLARLVELINPLEPQVRLYGPDGIQITGDWGYTLAEFLTPGLPVGGTHTLLVMDNPGVDTGDYSLHLQCINDPPGAIAFPLGATLGGTVAEPAQSVAYTLAGTAGDQLVVRLAEADGSGDYYPEVRVYAPDGTPLASSTGGAVAGLNTVALLASGIHTVLVLDYHGTDIGDYLLHVQRTNEPVGAVPMTYGSAHTDTLHLRAETVALTFVGATDDTLQVRMVEITPELEPQVRLYGPDGIQLASDWGYSEAVIAGVTLTENGTYTLLAMDRPGLDTGSFRVVLNGGEGQVAVPDVPVAELRLLPCRPNPFNPATTVRFDLVRAGNVLLTVHAFDGRHVATLAAESWSAGRHAVVWRGRDDAGRSVASGTYLVRLQTGGQQFVRRATLIK